MSARKTGVTVASAACLAIACGSVKNYEGYAPTVVPDRLAGGLPTGGYGETEGVKLGETHSEKYWSDRLARRLAEEYDAGIGQCIRVELPDGIRAMAISGSYNAGVDAMCKSPMVARWNAGDLEGGCKAFLTKNAAGQFTGWRIRSHPQGPGGPFVVQKGLINRRAKERAECLAGLRERPAPVVVASPAPAPKPAPVPAPVPPAAEAPKPAPLSFWQRFWHRLYCWIFKC